MINFFRAMRLKIFESYITGEIVVSGRGSGGGGEKWLEVTGGDGGGNAQVVERRKEGRKRGGVGSAMKEGQIRKEHRGKKRAGR